MAHRPEGIPDLDQTADQPAAATGRRVETSVETPPSREQATGAYTPVGDASSLTGGYTPSDTPIAAPAAPAVPGYEILDELGRGGMGVVYRARQIGLNRVVALKMILAGAHAREKDLERFRSEAHAVARFQHPNIVQIHDVGEANGLPYFSLEFVVGGPLSKKIDRDPQPPRYSAEIVEALARAMQYSHDRGIAHRDLKPANVLLADDGSPKITDFGIAKRLEGDSGQTQAGQVLGTPNYMAPEQAYGDAANAGPPADIYALGATLYDLLTGRPPFSGSSVIDTLDMVRTREPVPPGNLAGKIPRDLETICLKCLQKDPARRYHTAGELAEDLRRFLDGRPILARPVGSVEKAWRWAKRNPWVAGLGSAVALLLLTVAIVTSVLSIQLNRKKNEALVAKNDAQDAARLEEIAKNKAIDEQHKAEMARDAETKARETTAMQRRLALDVVRGVVIDVDSQMRNDAKFAPLRLKIMEKLLSDLDKIRDHALRNPLEDRTEAAAFARIGDVYMSGNRISDGAHWLRKAFAIVEEVAAENPNDPAVLFSLAGINLQVGDAEWRLGNGAKARAHYAAALAIRQRRLPIVAAQEKEGKSKKGNTILGQIDIAKSYGVVAFADLRLGDLNRALTNYLASDKAYSGLPERERGFLVTRRARAEIQVRLGDIRLRQRMPDAAKKHYEDALAERETLLKLTPKPANLVAILKSDIAQGRIYYGDYWLMATKDVPAAIREYTSALEIYDEVLKSEPENLDLQRAKAATHYRLGVVLPMHSGQVVAFGPAITSAAAIAHLAQCYNLRSDLAKIDPNDYQSQSELMLIEARLGKTANVEKAAINLLAKANHDRQVLIQIACGLSIASAGSDEAASRCRNEAIRLLGVLIDRGWKDRIHLETDPDLDAVRSDKRFAELIARLNES